MLSGRCAAGSAITNSGELRTTLSRGSPVFPFRRKHNARVNRYRQDQPGAAIASAEPAPSMTLCCYGSNLTRKSWPGWLRQRPRPPRAHSPHRRGREADRSSQLPPDWRSAGGVCRLVRCHEDIRGMDPSSGFEGCRFAIACRTAMTRKSEKKSELFAQEQTQQRGKQLDCKIATTDMLSHVRRSMLSKQRRLRLLACVN